MTHPSAPASLNMSIVLYGGGSSTIVEVEESCARLGIEVVAIVKNVQGPDHALARERVIDADGIRPEMTSSPYLVPIFTPGHRLAAQKDAGARGFTHAATVVDPTAVVARSATIAAGTYINAGAIIGGATAIGPFCFVNRGASIGHHVVVGEFASIGPGAIICGETRLARGSVVSAGAMVLPGVEIGRNSVVAAGAVVREPVADHCLVAGSPARVVKTGYPGYRNLSV